MHFDLSFEAQELTSGFALAIYRANFVLGNFELMISGIFVSYVLIKFQEIHV
jgi:hypothetical protein